MAGIGNTITFYLRKSWRKNYKQIIFQKLAIAYSGHHLPCHEWLSLGVEYYPSNQTGVVFRV